MNISLYYNKAENNRVNKTDYLEHICTVSGTLRNSTSIVNPTIIIDERTVATHSIYANENQVYTSTHSKVVYNNLITYEDIIKANYMYIPEFNRYYFVKDISSINQGLWEITCNCDVLYSFKDSLLNLQALVERNQFQYNDNIEDKLVSFENDKKIDYTIINQTTPFSYGDNGYGQCIIVTIYNTVATTLSPETSKPTANIPLLRQGVNSAKIGYGTFIKSYMLDTISELTNLLKSVVENENIASYIYNITAYPFASGFIATKPTETISEIGKHTLDYPFRAREIMKQAPPYIEACNFVLPKIHNDEWLNRKPYTEYQLYVPYANTIELDYELCKDDRIYVYYVPNFLNGTTSYLIMNNNYKIISQGDTTLGISIPVNSANNQAISDAITSSTISAGITGTTAVLTALVAGAMAPVAPALSVGLGISSFASSLKAVGDVTTTALTQHEKMDLKGVSGVAGAYSPQSIVLYTSTCIPAFDTKGSSYLKLVGKPLKKTLILSSLSGFTSISGIHLENINCTSTEKEAIELALQQGVIL